MSSLVLAQGLFLILGFFAIIYGFLFIFNFIFLYIFHIRIVKAEILTWMHVILAGMGFVFTFVIAIYSLIKGFK